MPSFLLRALFPTAMRPDKGRTARGPATSCWRAGGRGRYGRVGRSIRVSLGTFHRNFVLMRIKAGRPECLPLLITALLGVTPVTFCSLRDLQGQTR